MSGDLRWISPTLQVWRADGGARAGARSAGARSPFRAARSARISSGPPRPTSMAIVPGKLASPDPGPGAARVAGQHFVTGADVSARWWAAFRSPAARRSRQAVGRAQSDPAGRRSRDQGRPIQRAGPARVVLSASHAAIRHRSRQLLSNAGSRVRRDLGAVPQTQYSLVTNQLTVTFVPDIWGANFRAVENLDAVTEQQSVPARGGLSRADQQCRDRRDPGSVAARPDRRDPAHHRHRAQLLDILKRQFNAGQAAQADVLAQDAAARRRPKNCCRRWKSSSPSSAIC